MPPTLPRAVLDGLARAPVARLLVVGLASALETGHGVALTDTPGCPQEYRSLHLAHAAGTQVLRTATTGVDRLVVSPAGDFAHGRAHSGRYRTAMADATGRISYGDEAA